MLDDAWKAICEGHGHPAMGDFDADAVLAELRSRFPSAEAAPDNALIAEVNREGILPGLSLHAPYSAAQEYTGVLMKAALGRGLMLWDRQAGLWGNRRPPRRS